MLRILSHSKVKLLFPHFSSFFLRHCVPRAAQRRKRQLETGNAQGVCFVVTIVPKAAIGTLFRTKAMIYIINIINKKTAPISRSSFKFMLLVLYYSTILSTTPAPSVRPPSLIANLIPCSIATGAINSTSITTLSPGITISPSNLIEPVTSVVLM